MLLFSGDSETNGMETSGRSTLQKKKNRVDGKGKDGVIDGVR